MLFDKYREIANLCRRSIVEFDIERERRMLNANNVGAFYKFVNNKVGRNHGVGPLSMNNVIFTSDWDKAAILNQYFESVFTNDNNILPDFPMRVNDCIDDIHVSPSIVLKISKNLKLILLLARIVCHQFFSIKLHQLLLIHSLLYFVI